jgi:hypothetical protein
MHVAMVYELKRFWRKANVHCFQVLHSPIFQNASSTVLFMILHITNLTLFSSEFHLFIINSQMHG